MPRNYDASALTQRRSLQATFTGFTMESRRHSVFDASFLSAVRAGAVNDYRRPSPRMDLYTGSPLPISVPTPSVVTPPAAVNNLVLTLTSLSWQSPENGPFTYTITLSLRGTALPTITTQALTYAFPVLEEGQSYTVTVTAVNAAGPGPATTVEFLAPPADLVAFLAAPSAPSPACFTYVINAALEDAMKSIILGNVGPTRAARLLYLYVASLAQAWNWISTDTMEGMHDHWDWTMRSAAGPLSSADALVWMMSVTKYLNSFLSTTPSLFVLPADLTQRVKAAGGWEAWRTEWSAWYAQRLQDGSTEAAAQPTDSANWSRVIDVNTPSVDINTFPAPQEWTRLQINGTPQQYITYQWGTVASTCLTSAQEALLLGSVMPVYGADRDAEIDAVLAMSAALTDQEKVIAEFWAGSTPQTMSPPLMCMWLLKEYVRIQALDPRTIIYSMLDLAVHLFEGSRVTWALKAEFMQARPIQEIRRRYAGTQVQSWNGEVNGASWVPYQSPSMVTPSFADFPSGHSHFSKAFSLTMTKWFGAAIQPLPLTYHGESLFCPSIRTDETTTFGTFTVPARSSLVQATVPSQPVTLTFATWEDMAAQAGISRLYGGIHGVSAHLASQTTAEAVDALIQSSWNIRTA